MAESSKFIKNNNFSMNRLLLLVYLMALMFVPQSSTLRTQSNQISCSDSRTCTNCTINGRCVWSLEQQVCANEFNSSSLLVSDIAKCPRISLNKQHQYFKYEYHESVFVQCILNVSNDSVGFMNYLKNSKIYLSIGRSMNMDNVAAINNLIIFKRYEHSYYWNSSKEQSVTRYVSVNFNGVNLQFENEADHYLTIYKRECADGERDKYCATCAWISDGRSNYLKWCPSNNTCDGRYQFYLNDGTAAKGGELCPVNDVARVNNDCAEINVTAVYPLSGPRAGGTVTTITVRNHWIFAENGTVTVTVAGTECANPRTSGPETITCTTWPPVRNATRGVTSGPVRVQYSSPEGTVMKVESSQTFRFVVDRICGAPRPVLDARQLLSGIVSGGTVVPVRGVHFVDPCTASRARLFVVLADGYRQRADGYCDSPVNDTYMVCRSPRANRTGGGRDARPSLEGWRLSFGLDLDFAGNRSVRVDGPALGFYVHPDPVVADLEIDENGSVVVNGYHLQYVRPDDVAVRSRGSAYVGCAKASTTSYNRVVCVPTTSVSRSREMMVRIGTNLEYEVVDRTSPHSDDPSTTVRPTNNWFLATIVAPSSVSLVLVCALLWYLRMKNWYGCHPETASDPPVRFRWTARPRHNNYRIVT